MRYRSITFKIFLLVTSAFIFMAISINIMANRLHHQIINNNQQNVYSEKLHRIRAKLDRSHERLIKTQLIEAYTEDFKSSVIKELRQVFYKENTLPTYPFILDNEGTVVMHPTLSREDTSLQKFEWVKTMLLSNKGDFTTDYLDQESWFIHFKFSPWNWTVCYVLPLELKYNDLKQFQNILTIIIIGVSGVSLLILGLIIPKFTHPITELTIATQAMSVGNFEQKLDLNSSGTDEVQSLTHSFIHMRDSTNKAISELKQEIHKRKEVETTLLKKETQLQEQKNRLQAITENVPGAVYQSYSRKNGENGIHYASPKFYDIFGLNVSNNPTLLRQAFFQNIHEDDQQSWRDSVKQVTRKPSPWNWKGRYVKPSGEIIWFEVRSTPTIHEDEVVFNGICIDITQNIKHEKQKLEASLQKEQLIKLESLKTMAGAIAHRFNNAMTAVQGNLELMTRILKSDSIEHKMASDAAYAANDASLVGSRMLSYVGQQQPKLATIPLETVVKKSLAAFENSLNPAISLRFTPPKQQLYCSIDQVQINEVLESVITNAIESLDNETGTIEISVGCDHFSMNSFPAIFHNDEFKGENYVFCQIKDSGHGISQQNLLRIFEPFYTTKFIGRGLGLALTVGAMQAHHGAITIESSLEKGTTVRILLPEVPASEKEEPFPKDTRNAFIQQLTGNILLADDDEMVLDVGRNMLELLGLTVHTVKNGQEALDAIRENSIEFSMAVLDVSMPEMDGIEAMKSIKKIDPSLPILLSSGYSEENLPINKERTNQHDGFISKPFQLTDIKNILENVLS